jgi:CubicO group peptidase (beta-lactamase class C family)
MNPRPVARPLAFVLIILLFSSSCNVLKYNVPDITDYRIFKTEKIQKSEEPFQFVKLNNTVLPEEFLWTISKKSNKYYDYATPEEFLEAHGTTSFIIIRNDSVIYEKYFNGFNPDDIQTVFSVTKSFAATLAAIAIQEGYIKDINQPVSDFIPEYKQKGRDKMTINHLIQMTSGVAERDLRNLAKLLGFYYCDDQTKRCEKLKMRYTPGTRFQYSSMTTQILGICVERATGKRFSEYLQEKIWEPLGMEHDALIALDQKGVAKQFGGLAANPMDLARFGRLYLNNGNWNGKQIIPESWVRATQTRDTSEGRSHRYSNGWWLDTYPLENQFDKYDYFAGGFRGQVIYVNPDNNTIIVRTGKREGSVHWGRSLSKLSYFPIQNTHAVINENNIASLEGKYENKYGKVIKLAAREGKIILKDNDEEVELVQSSEVTFKDPKNKRQLLIEFKRDHIKGLILEANGESYFFQKN